MTDKIVKRLSLTKEEVRYLQEVLEFDLGEIQKAVIRYTSNNLSKEFVEDALQNKKIIKQILEELK